jgi:hypothetical protein
VPHALPVIANDAGPSIVCDTAGRNSPILKRSIDRLSADVVGVSPVRSTNGLRSAQAHLLPEEA